MRRKLMSKESAKHEVKCPFVPPLILPSREARILDKSGQVYQGRGRVTPCPDKLGGKLKTLGMECLWLLLYQFLT